MIRLIGGLFFVYREKAITSVRGRLFTKDKIGSFFLEEAMDQYTVQFGENGDPTRMVVWGKENKEREGRRALRDVLLNDSARYVVMRAEIQQDACGVRPFIGIIYFCPEGGKSHHARDLRIETTDSTLLSGLRTLFARIAKGEFGRVSVENKADSGFFLNFNLVFHKIEAGVPA